MKIKNLIKQTMADLRHVIFLLRWARYENTKIQQSLFVVYSLCGDPDKNTIIRQSNHFVVFSWFCICFDGRGTKTRTKKTKSLGTRRKHDNVTSSDFVVFSCFRFAPRKAKMTQINRNENIYKKVHIPKSLLKLIKLCWGSDLFPILAAKYSS
jgi:hypothetical protein